MLRSIRQQRLADPSGLLRDIAEPMERYQYILFLPRELIGRAYLVGCDSRYVGKLCYERVMISLFGIHLVRYCQFEDQFLFGIMGIKETQMCSEYKYWRTKVEQ